MLGYGVIVENKCLKLPYNTLYLIILPDDLALYTRTILVAPKASVLMYSKSKGLFPLL